MQIKNINYKTRGNKAVLSADLVFDATKHHVYFEVDRKYQRFISKDANPFLPMALAICMKKDERLEIEGKISKRLLSNTPKIMDTLENWNMGFRKLPISAKSVTQKINKSNKVGCFFSGGVDSFYTYLKNKKTIDYFVFVHGFDIPIQDEALYKNVEKHIIDVANQEKVNLIRVKTNIREILDQYFYWDIACEFALASTGLFLSKGLGKIYVSGGEAELDADYHFTAPELDDLFSAENYKFKHFGCEETKIEKIEFLTKSQTVMNNLRVCWVNKNGQYNCGECEKCVRTMLALYVCDALQNSETFPQTIDTTKLKNMRIEKDVLPYSEAILSALVRKGDESEIRFALEEAVKNNAMPSLPLKITNRTRELIRFVDNKYNRNRLYWFLTNRDFI